MNPTASVQLGTLIGIYLITAKFSKASIQQMCTRLKKDEVKCYKDHETPLTLAVSQCGNGIKEAGEDCDCGILNGLGLGCSTHCCDPKTCKFINGAQCDPATDLCCDKKCKVKGKGTMCKPSKGVCDNEKICDGISSYFKLMIF
jgi:hypothetical protein